MIPVKICGITNYHDALACIDCGATALGFVFAPSPRQVEPGTVREITRRLPPFITKVGVFVDQDPWLIKELLQDCGLDLAQLHGAETPAVVDFLAGRVIKAFRAGHDRPDLEWQRVPLQAILIDSYHSGVAGGSGISFDWNQFNDFRVLGFPQILAGGLNPGNIGAALSAIRPDGLDVSSGVERQPGLKDTPKVSEFMAQVQAAERDQTKE